MLPTNIAGLRKAIRSNVHGALDSHANRETMIRSMEILGAEAQTSGVWLVLKLVEQMVATPLPEVPFHMENYRLGYRAALDDVREVLKQEFRAQRGQ